MPDVGAAFWDSFNAVRSMREREEEKLRVSKNIMGYAEQLTTLGIDETGRPVSTVDQEGKPVKGIEPLVNPKAYEYWKGRMERDREQATGALKALVEMGTMYARHAGGDQATWYQRESLDLRRRGAARRDVQEARIQKSARQRELIARQKSLDAFLKLQGIDRQSLFAFDVQKSVDPEGRMQDDKKKPLSADKLTHVAVPSPDPIKKAFPVILPVSRLRAYQRSAAAASGNPDAVKVLEWLEKNPNDPRVPRAKEWLQQAISSVIPEPVEETVEQPEPEQIPAYE